MSPPARRGRFGAFSGILETGVGASKVLDYVGDDANDREIDLGDDYDVVLVIEDSNVATANHLALAYAIRDAYGVFFYFSSTPAATHRCGSGGSQYWQGKMSGVDANKIKLGIGGASPYGTNASGVNYRVLGLKLS
jgi:hypothetical protein